MSEKKDPYHRRFSRPVWYRDLPEFPAGRHPLHDLFRDRIMQDIEGSFGCGKLAKKEMDSFQNDLRLLAKDYLTFVMITPTGLADGPKDISMSKRRRWLERNVVNPIDKLLDSLSEHNIDHFAEWMDLTNSPSPNKNALIRELKKLRAYSDCVFYDYTEGGARAAESYTRDFLFDFYSSLTQIILFYYPKLETVVGGREVEDDVKLGSGYTNYLKICRRQIFPNDPDPTEKLIVQVIKAQAK